MSDFCKNETPMETISADDKRVATVFVRDCGATTNWNTEVAVQWKSGDPRPDDVVFIADGKPDVQIEWLDDRTLSVVCNKCTEDQIYKRVAKLGKVNVLFNP
jgi:hypothetical protein